MKTKFSKKELILDDYIRKRYNELLELKQDHEESIKHIRKEMKQLEERKMKLMGFES